jgi:hypothetical protein
MEMMNMRNMEGLILRRERQSQDIIQEVVMEDMEATV